MIACVATVQLERPSFSASCCCLEQAGCAEAQLEVSVQDLRDQRFNGTQTTYIA